MASYEEPSSTESYELGDDSVQFSDSSVDPLDTDAEEEEMGATTSAPFGTGVLVRSSLMNDGKPLDVCMQPARMSIYHGTTYVNDFAGGKIATMKSDSSGLNVIMGIAAGTLTTAVAMLAAKKDEQERNGFMQAWKYIRNGPLGQYRKTKSKKETGLLITKFITDIGSATRTKVAVTAGIATAITLNVLKPRYSFQDSSKRTQLTARWKRSRDAFVIKYTAQKGVADVNMIFIMKLNKETKKWELYSEQMTAEEGYSLETQDELEDDQKSAAADAVDIHDVEEAEKKEDKSSPTQEDIDDMRAGSSGDVVDLGEDADEGYESDSSVMDLQAPKLETPSPAPDAVSPSESAMMDKTESQTPELEIPAKWKRGASFGTPDGNFKFTIEKMARFGFNVGGKRIIVPLVGSSESYNIEFKGPTTVPRDVLVFASYIVRQNNVLPLDLLLLWFIFVGQKQFWGFILGVIGLILNGPEWIKQSWQQKFPLLKKPDGAWDLGDMWRKWLKTYEEIEKRPEPEKGV